MSPLHTASQCCKNLKKPNHTLYGKCSCCNVWTVMATCSSYCAFKVNVLHVRHYLQKQNPFTNKTHTYYPQLNRMQLTCIEQVVGYYTVRQLYNATDFISTKIEVPSMMQCMPSICPNFICNLTTPRSPTLSMTGNTVPCCAGSERTWSQ